MKGNFAMFSFMILCVALITCVDIKRNLGYVWFLEPHTTGKLIFLGPHISDKLIFLITCVDIEQNLDHVWFLRPHTLGKLIFLITCMDIK